MFHCYDESLQATISVGWLIRRKLIRKSKDYVYGIWVYKVLGIWKGYYRVKKNHWFHTWNREQRQEIINIWNITPNLHTNSHFEMWAESGLPCRRQVVHPRPQTPQGESVAKPETPLLIIISIACKWGPWQHVQSVIRKAKSVDKNILKYAYIL